MERQPRRKGRCRPVARSQAVVRCGILMLVAAEALIGDIHSSRAFHGVRLSTSRASFLHVGTRTSAESVNAQVDWPAVHFVKGNVGLIAGAVTATALVGVLSRRDAASTPQVQESKTQTWFQQSVPTLLILLLVLQKCSADALTWITRAKLHMTYSASNVALVSEILKFPILMLAVVIFTSAKELVPTIQAALTESPFAMWWVGLLYAVQNLLYFVCLQYTSAAAYQVLSQTKLIFTAAFMWQMLGKSFSRNQIMALAMLMAGTVFTQLAEIRGPMEIGSRPWFGAALAVLSALLAALPNVFYERMLKAQKNQWVSNLQLTTWICAWVAIIKGCAFVAGGQSFSHPSALFEGFGPMVWAIIALKTLNCIIIPACLKYADNILYGYAKPVSIVLTVVVTAFANQQMPSSVMLSGISLVAISIVVYGRG